MKRVTEEYKSWKARSNNRHIMQDGPWLRGPVYSPDGVVIILRYMDVAVFRTVWRGRNIQLCITNMVHATSRSLAIHAGKFARDVAAGKYDKARRHKRKEGV